MPSEWLLVSLLPSWECWPHGQLLWKEGRTEDPIDDVSSQLTSESCARICPLEICVFWPRILNTSHQLWYECAHSVSIYAWRSVMYPQSLGIVEHAQLTVLNVFGLDCSAQGSTASTADKGAGLRSFCKLSSWARKQACLSDFKEATNDAVLYLKCSVSSGGSTSLKPYLIILSPFENSHIQSLFQCISPWFT